MHRFFSPQSNLNSAQITISDLSEIHHMRDVLRLKEGAKVVIFDGSGKEAAGIISRSKEQTITIAIQSVSHSAPSRKAKIILACAIPKKTKFEFIIEKCTELGVDEIIPLATKRTEFRWDDERIQKKAGRYKTVAINAAKQSKRSTVPTIHPVSKFENTLVNFPPSTAGFIPCLIPDAKNLLSTFKISKEARNVIFFIGPEGDFTPDEVAKAIKAGCTPVSLGKTVLKVDTAAISVVALANLLLS